MNPERIQWIERWCYSWERILDQNDYSTMALSVAIGFVRELLEEIDNGRR